MLAQVGDGKCCLINIKGVLNTLDEGNRWANPVTVKDARRITSAEFAQICNLTDPSTFTPIKQRYA